MDDHDLFDSQAEEEVKRGAGAYLLEHIKARAEAEQARTQHLLGLLTADFDSEQQEDDDDNKEAA
jgi:hypothetical protein